MENNEIIMEEVEPTTYMYGPGGAGVACGADCTGIACVVGGGGICGGACNGALCGGEC